MGQGLAIAVIFMVSIAGVLMVSRSEKRRALRHMNGREPLSPAAFARQFFRGSEISIAEQLIGILSRHLPIDLGRLHPDDRLVEDLRMYALDSLSTTSFVIDIEKTMGMKIPNNVAEKIFTFRQVVQFVASARMNDRGDR